MEIKGKLWDLCLVNLIYILFVILRIINGHNFTMSYLIFFVILFAISILSVKKMYNGIKLSDIDLSIVNPIFGVKFHINYDEIELVELVETTFGASLIWITYNIDKRNKFYLIRLGKKEFVQISEYLEAYGIKVKFKDFLLN